MSGEDISRVNLSQNYRMIYRTYTFNDRRYGHYQPNGYGANYPGRNPPGQYPQGMPNEDRFRFDPVRSY